MNTKTTQTGVEEIVKELHSEFNKFVQEWLPECERHLCDTDDNDGQFFRDKITNALFKAKEEEREKAKSLEQSWMSLKDDYSEICRAIGIKGDAWFGDPIISHKEILEHIKTEISQAKKEGAREELDVLETWLWENGITHKESARNLMAFIKERQKLSNNT